VTGWLNRATDAAGYWSKWLALNVFGPAQQDEEHDPVARLKRTYGRE
jgi:hypothetical protein